MKNKKKLVSVLLVGIINTVVVSCSFLAPNDILNVQLEGCIYENDSKKPLQGCKIVVFNSSYIEKEGDYTDYSSYLYNDTISLVSNQNGKFKTSLKRSSNIDIRVYKNGYQLTELYSLKPKKNTIKNFYLIKGTSKEADLLKPVEIIEIIE